MNQEHTNKSTKIIKTQNEEVTEEDNNEENDNKLTISDNPNELMLNRNTDLSQKGKQPKKEYTPIKSYKPSGNLVYDDHILDKIEDKFV